MDDLSQDELKGIHDLEVKLSQTSQLRGPDVHHRILAVGESSQESDTRRGSSPTSGSLPEMPPFILPSFMAGSSTLHGVSNASLIAQSVVDPDNPFVLTSPVVTGVKSDLITSRKRGGSSSDEENLPVEPLVGKTRSPSPNHIALQSKPTPISGFSSASNVLADVHTPGSPDGTSEKDYSSWFSSTVPISPVGFLSGKAALTSVIPEVPSTVVFTTAAMNKVIVPSETAMQQAEVRMKLWEAEADQADAEDAFLSQTKISPISPPRPVLVAVENSLVQGSALETAGPALGLSRASTSGFSTPFQSASAIGARNKNTIKGFKSPLIRNNAAPLRAPVFAPSPLNPGRPTMAAASEIMPVSTPVRALRSTVPWTPDSSAIAGTSSMATPVRRAAFSTPPRALGITTRARQSGQKPFISPFKPGMRPGEPGRTQLEEKHKRERATAMESLVVVKGGTAGTVKASRRTKFFDLKLPADRKTLLSSGLVPQAHNHDTLNAKGINAHEMAQITPETALYYSFYTTSTAPLVVAPGSPPLESALGPDTALQELKKLGCTLATKEWVENHWSLILWKLSGMVRLDPERERDGEKRWCWGEVIRQLRYRYEKELNGGQRPAFRLITTHDSPPGCPMVVCVSNIIWSEDGTAEDGSPVLPHPELEVTDGWYKLRAEVDPPLERAVRKGFIRVGRKLAVTGAKLSGGKSEPCEVLEAYGSHRLMFSGNSSHLAPWHAKLGFQPHPPIATLNSLTPDGGLVQLLDLTVIKAYPIAFIEFFVDENSRKRRAGPRKEDEEAQVQDQWQRRRDREESKLRKDILDKLEVYETWADRLERKAGEHTISYNRDATMPSHIEDLFDLLNEGKSFSDMLRTSKLDDAYWLGRFLRERIEKERETMVDDIERDLKEICPPRDVRSFRVLFMKDACTSRKPANLIVEVTVWDVLNLQFDEGKKPGHFKEGERFLVTNLLPLQQSAWMHRAQVDGHIYLATRRDSRWTKKG